MAESILLIDDEEGIRTVLSLTLRDAGYDVRTAAGGEEGLSLFADYPPSIVITDIKMPGLSGLDILRRVKAEHPETEVLIITGHGDMDMAIESLRLGAGDFITKPINDDAMDIALRRAQERLDMRRKLKEHTENLERLVEEKSAKLVEAERKLAGAQIVDSMTETMQRMAEGFNAVMPSFSDMPCFVSLHTRDRKVAAHNTLYAQRLGDKIGKPSWEVYMGGGAEKNCPVCSTFLTGKGVRVKETMRCKNGNKLPVLVHTSPVKGVGDDVELVLEIAADMKEVDNLREELRVSQHKFRQLFDEAPCYICVLDKNLCITSANRRFTDDFGDLAGRQCFIYTKDRKEPCPHCPVKETFADGKPHQMETVITAKTGELLDVIVWTAPVTDAKGEIVEVIEMAVNITEVRKLQSHLTNLGILLGSTAHGIKGMLTALDGSIYRIGSGLEKGDAERTADGFADVKHLVERIKHLVLDILYYAKTRELSLENVSIGNFVDELERTAQPKAEDKGVTLTCEFADDLGNFTADKSILASAVMNLLENAVDACVVDRGKDEHIVRFHARREADSVVFAVEDNGTGMDEETRDKLFTLFFSSKGSGGTGIGLFIANYIVQQHGGVITVDSEPGSGSTFTVRLPLNFKATQEEQQPILARMPQSS